jgi:hypothetical protein
MVLQPISRERFAIFALSLPTGPNFGPLEEISWWSSQTSSSVGVVTFDPATGRFGGVAMRRDIDHRFVAMPAFSAFPTSEAALLHLSDVMRPADPPEPRLPGRRRRPNLFDIRRGTTLSPGFKVLYSTITHRPALYTVGEIYFALDRPDDNFVQDFQTEGFDARIWELYLFASFREQAIQVSQTCPSPDFELTRDGRTVFVEALTANAESGRQQSLPRPDPHRLISTSEHLVLPPLALPNRSAPRWTGDIGSLRTWPVTPLP